MHHDAGVAGEVHKPEIIMHYHATKSGVDNRDNLAIIFTAMKKVNRWPVVLFVNCIDGGTGVAFIIWPVSFPEWKASEWRRRRRLFLLELAHELIMPYGNEDGWRSISCSTTVGSTGSGCYQKENMLPCLREIDNKVRLECGAYRNHVCTDHCTQQIVCEQSIWIKMWYTIQVKKKKKKFLQNIMIDNQFILLTISQVIVWQSVILLFSSDTLNMPILAGKLAKYRWYFLTNDLLTDILVVLCCYHLYVAHIWTSKSLLWLFFFFV